MDTRKQTSEFFREYDLTEARRHGVAKSPAPHQAEALQELDKWYGSPQKFCYINNFSGAIKEECSLWTVCRIPRLTFEFVPPRPC